ncbi:MAG: hypothetical protein Q8Q65_02810 [bacterium]|nr:hypothetical protein [bacterium]
MKHQIVYVRYTDTAVYDLGEFSPDHDFKLVIFDAIGWLVKEDEAAVYLAREINTTNNNSLRAVLGIPKVNIIKRQELGAPKAKS